MALNSSFLLPSQDALLQRLQHVVLYGQQLTVLTGDDGCGKTSILTALVEELTEVSSAFVTCPMHCDSAEIRRKILVQLLSEPAFDDEIPMPETLLKLASSLPAASHIVLDDAHYLPLEIWAECIVLSQLSLNGRRITVTLSTTSQYLDSVIAQLPENDDVPILPMVVEPLGNEEREGLYYILLSRSEQVPFTPRDIVTEQLAKQNGLPAEVVSLFELALNGEPEPTPQKAWLKPAIALLAAVLVGVLGYLLISDSEPQPVSSKTMTVSEARAHAVNLQYARNLLLPYFEYRVELSNRANIVATASIDPAKVDPLPAEPDAELNKATGDASQIKATTQDADIASNPASKVETFAVNSATSSEPATKITAPTSEPQSLPQPAQQLESSTGVDTSQTQLKAYTLQLASVKQRKSLQQILARFADDPQVRVAKDKQRWVVLYGDFVSNTEALQQGQKLVSQYGISQPWLRAWKDIGHYDLQKALPSREIP
ncbi:AAA family ATPase [Shewanella waksmanii]|uniref:AAA family ATPase n=1 Tax=Shewanella waksmanii TaxID=213783 RepID=UPI0004921F0C|nr:AAA family ATPase [Shewanella waksmanii]